MLINVKLDCQLVKGLSFKVADFIGLFNFEWNGKNKVGNIAILVLWRDREKHYYIDVYGEFVSHHHVNHHQLVTNKVRIRGV